MARTFKDELANLTQGLHDSFEELEQAVDRVAKGLIGLGVGPGDKVALWLMNQPEWIYLLFAIARIG
ncbi:MAG: AMP-binding protein, partial [Planctomycetota bacterium]|nr:AMP-binding protein [Planctomycetota bacterium]